MEWIYLLYWLEKEKVLIEENINVIELEISKEYQKKMPKNGLSKNLEESLFKL